MEMTESSNYLGVEGRRDMKRNPLIPFALIAALGIIVMFVFSFQG